MKSYTDLEQSKILAEFLPIESADMYFEPSAGFCTEPSEVKVGDIKYAHPRSVPCWSLAALLSVIPKEVEIKGQRYAPCLFPTTDGHWLYKLWYNSNAIIDSPIAVWCDNPLDACVEMIIKLNEQKLL